MFDDDDDDDDDDGVLAQAASYTCYEDSETRDIPFDRLYAYIANISSLAPPSDGSLTCVCLDSCSMNNITLLTLYK